MARIFAYIAHRDGVPDDTAAELAAAAKRIDAAQTPTAVVTGWGAELDAVCDALRASYGEIWASRASPASNSPPRIVWTPKPRR